MVDGTKLFGESNVLNISTIFLCVSWFIVFARYIYRTRLPAYRSLASVGLAPIIRSVGYCDRVFGYIDNSAVGSVATLRANRRRTELQ